MSNLTSGLFLTYPYSSSRTRHPRPDRGSPTHQSVAINLHYVPVPVIPDSIGDLLHTNKLQLIFITVTRCPLSEPYLLPANK